LEGFHAGGVDFITRPFQEEIVLARVKSHIRIHQLTLQLMHKNRQLQDEIAKREQAEGSLAIFSDQEAHRWGIDGFISQSATIAGILNDVRQLQHADNVSVLITGESGTGKELIARAIHFGGSRSQKPFIALNCSTIPRDLAESTLFGHVRGAFTGATSTSKGCFELADGGTLFLDEIGDMPYDLQAKLLRVLEERRFVPVGGSQERNVNVRIISATNQNLQTLITQGAFRKDLYFRLAEFPVEAPPLRERPEDIPLLVRHFLHLFAEEMGRECPHMSDDALAALRHYSFPGNVRELKNIVEYAIIKSAGGDILPKHLHLLNDVRTAANATLSPASNPNDNTSADLEHLRDLVIKRSQSFISQERNIDQEILSSMTDEEKIIFYLEKYGTINNTECRKLLSSDFHHASYLLKKLRDYGLLKSEGERRWKRYRLV
ncbi:MAG: sigma 54-interacting transcriptional regulator, partial [Candidatus Hinthialibacter sp.]